MCTNRFLRSLRAALLCCPVLLYAQDPSPQSAMLKADLIEQFELFQQTSNAMDREAMIDHAVKTGGGKSLNKSRASDREQAQALEEMLVAGIHDRHDGVAMKAIRGIGKIRAAHLLDPVLEIYDDADNRFPGSQSVVRAAVIESALMIDNQQSRDFVRSLLANSEVSYAQNRAVELVGDKGDVSFLPDISGYCDRLKAALPQGGLSPQEELRIKPLRDALRLALQVKSDLEAKQGDSHE